MLKQLHVWGSSTANYLAGNLLRSLVTIGGADAIVEPSSLSELSWLLDVAQSSGGCSIGIG